MQLRSRRRACLTPAMPETDDSAEIDVTIETEVVDVDGDGVADIVSQTTTTTIDVDGDGVVDLVEVNTITASTSMATARPTSSSRPR